MRARADEHLARFEGEQALRAYEDALAIDSHDGGAAAGRLRALLLLGRYRAARYALPPLLVKFPRWPDAHVARGEAALGRRDDPVFAGIFDGSSQCDADAAREAFGDALRLDPECVQAWRGLAIAARLNGQLDDALTILAKAESEIGWRSGLALERAMCARDDGRLRDALD
jgi:tetratricopeptide (TPR) repeat protein